ncbi:MAG: hypothetical protein RLZ56_22 [Bacteroidota bacterium]
MASIIKTLSAPWPWYIAGLLIGLIVPALLLIGNKTFGISSNLRHICAACVPAGIPFFNYNWKKESWNLFFVGGIILGAYLANHFLKNPNPILIHKDLQSNLTSWNFKNTNNFQPKEIFSFAALGTLRGWIMMVGGGFLVGFGTRYANGCTSGHAIMGLSNLQWPSLIATISFMIGGFIMTQLLLPFILQLI